MSEAPNRNTRYKSWGLFHRELTKTYSTWRIAEKSKILKSTFQQKETTFPTKSCSLLQIFQISINHTIQVTPWSSWNYITLTYSIHSNSDWASEFLLRKWIHTKLYLFLTGQNLEKTSVRLKKLWPHNRKISGTREVDKWHQRFLNKLQVHRCKVKIKCARFCKNHNFLDGRPQRWQRVTGQMGHWYSMMGHMNHGSMGLGPWPIEF